MVCPYCPNNTRVSNTRQRHSGFSIWRRRFCNQCRNAFTTTERIMPDSLIVCKAPDGSLQPLKYYELYFVILKALGDSKEVAETAELLTNNCLEKIINYRQSTLKQNFVQRQIYESLSAYSQLAGQRYLVNEIQQTPEAFLNQD